MYIGLFLYFILGLTGISAVTETLVSRNVLTLSPVELVTIGIWTGLPWSMKILGGSILDSFPVSRQFYSRLGQLLLMVGTAGWIDITSSRYLFSIIGEYNTLLGLGLLSSIGLVLARLATDVHFLELEENQKKKVQLYSRLSLTMGGLAGALLTGWAATVLAPSLVFTIVTGMLACSFLVTCLSPSTSRKGSKAWGLLVLSVGYSIGIAITGILAGPLAVAGIAGSVLSVILYKQLVTVSDQDKKYLMLALLAIFMFRVSPSAGPGLTWYYLDELHLTPVFLGYLKITEAVVGIGLLSGLARIMTSGKISTILTILTIAITILQLPDILIYYHLTGPIDPRHLLLVDSAAVAGLSQLAMVPLGILVATRGPQENKAIFFALTSSLMNLALFASDIISRELNQLFPIERGHYQELGHLLLASICCSVVLSVLGILLLPREKNNG